AGTRAWPRCTNVHHPPHSARRRGLEFIQLRLESRLLQFGDDIVSSRPYGFTAGGSGTEADDFGQVCEGAIRAEWRVFGGGCAGGGSDDGKNASRQKRSFRP